jgi:Fe-S-cluster containining protein
LTADSGHSTATLRLTVGDIRIAHPISVPTASVPAAEVVPALQGLVNAVVGAAEDRGVAAGKTVSCRKGCGACCRQLVPISRTEGERLLAMVERLPEARQAALSVRFATASAALAEAGQRDGLLDPRRRAGKTDRELSTAYFALGIACPFLEEESCSIHPERPLICREYLVTSPAELCAGPLQAGVTPLAVPKLSLAARGLDESRSETDTVDRWFPLALLMEWNKHRSRGASRRPGPEWIQRFLGRLAVK